MSALPAISSQRILLRAALTSISKLPEGVVVVLGLEGPLLPAGNPRPVLRTVGRLL